MALASSFPVEQAKSPVLMRSGVTVNFNDLSQRKGDGKTGVINSSNETLKVESRQSRERRERGPRGERERRPRRECTANCNNAAFGEARRQDRRPRRG
ncbi:hypothetical protein FGB62_286g09 [Gracilaria domingensis]|nr:hypothetical protein FGB62_286g09 [Gracilaria domingensis]